MINLKRILPKVCKNSFLWAPKTPDNFRKLSNTIGAQVSEEVRFALNNNKPLVALESTIITHGMPYPENVQCALDVESEVRKQGAIPATIAIINGQIHVGLTPEQTSMLGDVKRSSPIKASRRDVAYIVNNKFSGGTTVSGTVLIANKMKIPIMATGGIGGVHREHETTLDVSADLIELGKSGVAVVCAGVKSILDIAKTLEYLETQGVFVATYGDTRDFPAFYCRKSGFQSPYNVTTAVEAAGVIQKNIELDIQSGMIFAVPVPEEHSLYEGTVEEAIKIAARRAREANITGKNLTPFLLSETNRITEGHALKTNIALIKNNAMIAAMIAVEYSELKARRKEPFRQAPLEVDARPVVIGGCNLDCSFKLQDQDLQMDGRIHKGKFGFSAGGVARNISEALFKLDCRPTFLSAIGNDHQGSLLNKLIPKELRNNIIISNNCNTAVCFIVFDHNGDCSFLLGDLDIHQQITPETPNCPRICYQTSLEECGSNMMGLPHIMPYCVKYSKSGIPVPMDRKRKPPWVLPAQVTEFYKSGLSLVGSYQKYCVSGIPDNSGKYETTIARVTFNMLQDVRRNIVFARGRTSFRTFVKLMQLLSCLAIRENLDVIRAAPIIVLDANLSIPTIESILNVAIQYNIAVFFEPTDVVISTKPFQTPYWTAVKFITPNLNEARFIASHLNINLKSKFVTKIDEGAFIAKKLAEYIDNVIITLGSLGLIVARRGRADESFSLKESYTKIQNTPISVRLYPAEEVENVVNVSGAGDSLASGIIAAILEDLPEEKCISVGLAAARTALCSSSAVADSIFRKNHKCWTSQAAYRTLQ